MMGKLVRACIKHSSGQRGTQNWSIKLSACLLCGVRKVHRVDMSLLSASWVCFRSPSASTSGAVWLPRQPSGHEKHSWWPLIMAWASLWCCACFHASVNARSVPDTYWPVHICLTICSACIYIQLLKKSKFCCIYLESIAPVSVSCDWCRQLVLVRLTWHADISKCLSK